jgi:hypothetical protein
MGWGLVVIAAKQEDMNITKELYDAMVALGFSFPPTAKTNQTEPNFLVVSYTQKRTNVSFHFRLPNRSSLQFAEVVPLLVESVSDSMFYEGTQAGKRAVGQYLQDLINI